MNKVMFLYELKRFTLDATRDLLLPVYVPSTEEEQERPTAVYLMRLPDSSETKERAPYILHQLTTGKDTRKNGERTSSTAQVRSTFCVYGAEEKGGMQLLNLMERLRIALLRQEMLDQRYQLDLGAGMKSIIYPDNTGLYYLGEMTSRWKLPGIEREVRP